MAGARRFAEHEVEFRRVEIHGRDAEKYLILASRSLGEQIEKWRRKILPTLARVGVRRRGQFFADLRPQAETILDRRANGVEQMASDLFKRVDRHLCGHLFSLTATRYCKPRAAALVRRLGSTGSSP